jgi:hypothetical protein
MLEMDHYLVPDMNEQKSVLIYIASANKYLAYICPIFVILKVMGMAHFYPFLRDLQVFQSKIGMSMATHMNNRAVPEFVLAGGGVCVWKHFVFCLGRECKIT